MPHIEHQFQAPPDGNMPVTEQYVFDECLIQNTKCKRRHMALGQSQNSWFLMNASCRISISGPAIWHQTSFTMPSMQNPLFQGRSSARNLPSDPIFQCLACKIHSSRGTAPPRETLLQFNMPMPSKQNPCLHGRGPPASRPSEYSSHNAFRAKSMFPEARPRKEQTF